MRCAPHCLCWRLWRHWFWRCARAFYRSQCLGGILWLDEGPARSGAWGSRLTTKYIQGIPQEDKDRKVNSNWHRETSLSYLFGDGCRCTRSIDVVIPRLQSGSAWCIWCHRPDGLTMFDPRRSVHGLWYEVSKKPEDPGGKSSTKANSNIGNNS